MGRRVLCLAAIVAGLAAGVAAAPAAADGSYSLTAIDSRAAWHNTLGTGAVVDPALCAVSQCDAKVLHVQLPSGAFSSTPSGLTVAVHWPDDQLDLGYDLNLYVYGPDGKLVASSTDLQYSSDEAAWVQNPRNGDYKVVITPSAELGDLTYDAVAYFQPGREYQEKSTLAGVISPWDDKFVVVGDIPPTPKQALLPDLVPVPAHNYHLDTTVAANFYTAFDRGLRHPPSCNPQETLGLDADNPGSDTPHPTRCLRFDSDLDNFGAGPYEIRAYPFNGNGTDAYQVIYNSDGTYAEHKAGEAIFSTAHGHVHFRGFDDTGLYTVDASGALKLVKAMADKGRCALDTHNPQFGMQGDSPMRYLFPSTCDTADNTDPNDTVYPNALFFRSGISAGWDDEYPWFIPDQFIDVSDVANGNYLIIDKINSARNVEESDYTDNTATACVHLEQSSARDCRPDEVPKVAVPIMAVQAAHRAHARRRLSARHHRRTRHHRRHHHRAT